MSYTTKAKEQNLENYVVCIFPLQTASNGVLLQLVWFDHFVVQGEHWCIPSPTYLMQKCNRLGIAIPHNGRVADRSFTVL